MAPNKRISITIDPQIVNAMRGLVKERRYPTVSFMVESIVRNWIEGEGMKRKSIDAKEKKGQATQDKKQKKLVKSKGK